MSAISDQRSARLTSFVAALREAFGDRAAEVALRQRDLADGESVVAWNEIVLHMGEQG